MPQSKLASLLEVEGRTETEAELLDLIEGVAAAPTAFDPQSWLSMIDPLPGPKLQEELNIRKSSLGDSVKLETNPQTKLSNLRGALETSGIDGVIIPRTDEYQGEYISAYAQRVAWLTEFTGSAGTVIVLKNKAVILVDGRYTLQAKNQVDQGLYEIAELAKTSLHNWLVQNLPPNTRLGYDPKLHTRASVTSLRKTCDRIGSTIVPITTNPIDQIWLNQPPPPLSPVAPHDIQLTGKSLNEKCSECAQKILASGADAVVLTLTDSICWLFNIRGSDVEFTPVSLAFAILHSDSSAELFIDTRKLTSRALRHLGNSVAVHEPKNFLPALTELGLSGKKVQIDPLSASEWIFQSLGNENCIIENSDPCVLGKAVKNSVELDGARKAHLRDGVAVTRFLYWLSQNAEMGKISEIGAADKLEQLRSMGEHFRGLSFPTISGTGPNGAIVHYRVDAHSDRTLNTGDLYLVDSGAQYLDGTTDVTRTVAIGAPSEEMQDRFTRVLKGHIAIATARFPLGTSGGQLDSLARLSLWEAGLDFQHGTGHGVGSFLSVHEGPQRISKHLGSPPLEAGMIVSNEPGYYKNGAYGIRIENLVAVVTVGPQQTMEDEFLEFKTLTLAPIDKKLIVTAMLNENEKGWLNEYHKQVHDQLYKFLEPGAQKWLRNATSPL